LFANLVSYLNRQPTSYIAKLVIQLSSQLTVYHIL